MTLWPLMRISPISPGATSLRSSSTTFISHALDRRPDRAGLALAVGMVERRDRRRLAEAVALEHLAAEALLEAAQDLDRQRRAAGGADAQLGDVVARRARGGSAARRTSSARPRRPCTRRARGSPAPCPGSKRGSSVTQAPAADRGVHRAGLAEGVKQRQAAEDHVADAEVEQADGDRDVAAQVVVRQLGALRLAGRARRVEDHGGVVAVDARRRPRRARGRRSGPRSRPGLTATTSTSPASSAPASAASMKPCQANSTLTCESER